MRFSPKWLFLYCLKIDCSSERFCSWEALVLVLPPVAGVLCRGVLELLKLTKRRWSLVRHVIVPPVRPK